MSRPARLARLLLALGALSFALDAPCAADAARTRTVLHYGDSLAVGTQLFLDDYLRGWRIRSDVTISKHATEVPGGLRSIGRALPRVIVVSAGTNDDPSAAARFARAVRETVAVAGPSRCVIWATVVRPPYEGVSYAGYNRALRLLARRRATLHVLDWAAMAYEHPGWFGSDGVHPSATGYRVRAAATARLIRTVC